MSSFRFAFLRCLEGGLRGSDGTPADDFTLSNGANGETDFGLEVVEKEGD
jgi:hypothetical protein